MYQKVTGTLEGQLLSESDCSVEQRRKYAAITNLGSDSDFAALDSNFCWLGGSTTLKTISNSRSDRLYNVIKPNGFQSNSYIPKKF